MTHQAESSVLAVGFLRPDQALLLTPRPKEIDRNNVDKLTRAFSKSIAAYARFEVSWVVLDLGKVTRIDTAGIRFLFGAWRLTAEICGSTLRICSNCPDVLRMLEGGKVHHAITTYPSVRDAMQNKPDSGT